MSFLDNADKQAEKTPMRTDSNAVLAREAGVPFHTARLSFGP